MCLHHPKSPVYIAAFGLLLMLPSLFVGFFADDYSFYALSHIDTDALKTDNFSFFDYFTFLTGDDMRTEHLIRYGALPWWLDREMKAIFFRPVSELTHFIDFHWIKIPWLMHLHSTLWYGLLLGVVYKIYRQFSKRRSVAVLGFLLFAVDGTHGFTVAWLANRNAIIATVFVLLALHCHHRFRQSQSIKMLGLSLLCVGLGLLSAEIAISVAAILFSYALFFDRDAEDKLRFDNFIALLPCAFLVLFWICCYKFAGFGAFSDGGYYNDVFGQPDQFLLNLTERLPVALSMQFHPLPLFHFQQFSAFTIISGYVIFVSLIIGAYFMKSRLYNFCLSSALLSFLPVLSVEAQERNFLVVGIFSCLMLSCAMRNIYLQMRRRLVWLLGPLLGMMLLSHLLFSTLTMPLYAYAPKFMGEGARKLALSLPSDIAPDKLIITLGSGAFESVVVNPIRFYHERVAYRPVINLVTNTAGLEIRREEDALIVRNEKGLLGGQDLLFRNPSRKPFKVSQVFKLTPTCDIEILMVDIKYIPTELKLACEGGTLEVVPFYRKYHALKRLNLGEERIVL